MQCACHLGGQSGYSAMSQLVEALVLVWVHAEVAFKMFHVKSSLDKTVGFLANNHGDAADICAQCRGGFSSEWAKRRQCGGWPKAVLHI